LNGSGILKSQVIKEATATHATQIQNSTWPVRPSAARIFFCIGLLGGPGLTMSLLSPLGAGHITAAAAGDTAAPVRATKDDGIYIVEG